MGVLNFRGRSSLASFWFPLNTDHLGVSLQLLLLVSLWFAFLVPFGFPF